MIKRVKKLRPVPTNCPYCKGLAEINYKDSVSLANYLSERGKIIGKARTGVCAKHMRVLGNAIAYARYLGLLPFVVRPQ